MKQTIRIELSRLSSGQWTTVIAREQEAPREFGPHSAEDAGELVEALGEDVLDILDEAMDEIAASDNPTDEPVG